MNTYEYPTANAHRVLLATPNAPWLKTPASIPLLGFFSSGAVYSLELLPCFLSLWSETQIDQDLLLLRVAVSRISISRCMCMYVFVWNASFVLPFCVVSWIQNDSYWLYWLGLGSAELTFDIQTLSGPDQTSAFGQWTTIYFLDITASQSTQHLAFSSGDIALFATYAIFLIYHVHDTFTILIRYIRSHRLPIRYLGEAPVRQSGVIRWSGINRFLE